MYAGIFVGVGEAMCCALFLFYFIYMLICFRSREAALWQKRTNKKDLILLILYRKIEEDLHIGYIINFGCRGILTLLLLSPYEAASQVNETHGDNLTDVLMWRRSHLHKKYVIAT